MSPSDPPPVSDVVVPVGSPAGAELGTTTAVWSVSGSALSMPSSEMPQMLAPPMMSKPTSARTGAMTGERDGGRCRGC